MVSRLAKGNSLARGRSWMLDLGKAIIEMDFRMSSLICRYLGGLYGDMAGHQLNSAY